MDKIYINLSPKQKREGSAFLKNISYYLGLGIFFLLIIIVILGVLIGIRATVYKYDDSKWVKWKEKYTILSKIKQDITNLENEKNEFKKLLTPKSQMSNIFEDIFSSLPKNIWFHSLDFKKDTLDIRGYVVRIDEDYLVSLEKFVNNLKAKKYFGSRFKKINIKDSQKKDFNGAEALEFHVECTN